MGLRLPRIPHSAEFPSIPFKQKKGTVLEPEQIHTSNTRQKAQEFLFVTLKQCSLANQKRAEAGGT